MMKRTLCSLLMAVASLSAWTLQEVEDYALVHNPALRAFEEIVMQGQYRQWQSWSGFGPSLSVDGAVDYTRVGLDARYKWKAASFVRFRQLVWSSAAYSNARLSAVALQQLKADQRELKNDVLFQIRLAYYGFVLAGETLIVEEQNKEILQAELEREELRLSLGETTEFEVNRARVAVTNARTRIHGVRRELEQGRNLLRELMGLDPRQALEVDDSEIPIETVDFVKPYLDSKETAIASNVQQSWEAQAMRLSPSLDKARSAQRSADRQRQQQRLSYLPTASLFATKQDVSTPAFSFSNTDSLWDVGLQFEWKLFDSGGRELRLQESKRRVVEADIAFEGAALNVAYGIRNQFHALEEALASFQDATEGVALAEQALIQASDRRDVGFLTPLEVRDAATALLVARLQEEQARFKVMQAYYQLRLIAGVDV